MEATILPIEQKMMRSDFGLTVDSYRWPKSNISDLLTPPKCLQGLAIVLTEMFHSTAAFFSGRFVWLDSDEPNNLQSCGFGFLSFQSEAGSCGHENWPLRRV